MNSLAALLIAKAVRARIEQGDRPTDEQQPRELVEEALCELQRIIAGDLVSQEYTALLCEVEGLRAILADADVVLEDWIGLLRANGLRSSAVDGEALRARIAALSPASGGV